MHLFVVADVMKGEGHLFEMLLEEELSQQARENQADEKSEVGSRCNDGCSIASRWSFIVVMLWLEQPPTDVWPR